MPSLQFTKALIDALPPALPGKRDYFNDPKVPGLQLVVTDKGSKSFVLYRRINRRPKRKFVGKYPGMPPELARKKATQLLAQLSIGIDLEEEERAERARQVTLRQAFTVFQQLKTALKPSTMKNYEHYFNKAFSSWHSRAMVTITKAMVSDRHRALTDSQGAAYADGAMRFLRALLNFANVHYEAPDGTPLLRDNPVRRLSQTRQWNRVKRRTTVLKVGQLPAWFAAVWAFKRDAPESQPHLVADYLLLLIFTGLRRSEGTGLRWEDIDFESKTLTVRGTKNGTDHTLPLPDFLFDLLKARHKVRTDSPFVFPGTGRYGRLTEPRPQMRRITEVSGVSFVLHDLRRTFATVADSLDLSSYALKRLINHKMTGDVTSGYIISDVERLRSPMQRIAAFLLERSGLPLDATSGKAA